jgi:rhamnosyl/mannosyltransferase
VVSCDVGTGVAWVNQDGVTGLVVPPRDPTALALAVRRLLDDPALQTRMGEAGRRRVLAEFTVERMSARVREVYDRVLSSTDPRGVR